MQCFTKCLAIALAGTGIIPAVPVAAQSPEISSTRALGPRLATPPAKFERCQIGNRTFLLMAEDRAWAAEASNALRPATRPTTLPSDLSQALSARRDTLRSRIMTDLALSDPSAVDAFFDTILLRTLQKMQDFHAPLVFLISGKQVLREIVKGGWDEPRFRYNRVANEVAYDDRINISLDRPMDDIVIPIVIDDGVQSDGRAKRLADIILKAEMGIARSVADRGQLATQASFAQFVNDNAIAPLGLKSGQQWFAVGLTGALSARYLETLSGMAHADLMRVMTYEHPKNPVKSGPIDLLHPTSRDDLRPQAAVPYADAYRRKSTAAMDAWLSEAGDGALPKVLAAIRGQSPADGESLAALILKESGIDLIPSLRAKR